MSRTSLPLERILILLRETPTRLAELTADLSEEALQMKPSSDEWSANEVLAHLRACADVWGTCMMKIIVQDRPTWRAINPRTWIKQTNYLELDFRPSLHTFTRQRADLLAVLDPLPIDAWSRTATVTGGGKPLELTVLRYAQRLAIHERPHIRQIEHRIKTIKGEA